MARWSRRGFFERHGVECIAGDLSCAMPWRRVGESKWWCARHTNVQPGLIDTRRSRRHPPRRQRPPSIQTGGRKREREAAPHTPRPPAGGATMFPGETCGVGRRAAGHRYYMRTLGNTVLAMPRVVRSHLTQSAFTTTGCAVRAGPGRAERPTQGVLATLGCAVRAAT